MTKIAGLTYVDEFTFPTEQGFTGSAGKENVRGYYRGGRVKDPVKAAAQKKRAPGPGASHGGYLGDSKKGMPKGVKARGGKMEYAEGGEVGVTTKQSKDMPQKAKQAKYARKSAMKAHGGEMSTHDKLRKEGEAMGYAYGGQVKNTSPEFVQKSMGQDSMDHANYPPGHAASARDKESGPRKKLRPRFKGGGGVHQVRDMPAKRRAKSGKGMPKGVKARGGLAEYAGGGYGKGGGKKSGKPGYEVGGTVRLDPSIVPGTGAAEKGARALLEHERQTSSVADAARADAMRAMQSTPVEQDVAPEPAAVATPKPKRKPAPGSERGKRQHYGLQFKKSVINPDVVGAAVGGPVTAAKGGTKKSRKMR